MHRYQGVFAALLVAIFAGLPAQGLCQQDYSTQLDTVRRILEEADTGLSELESSPSRDIPVMILSNLTAYLGNIQKALVIARQETPPEHSEREVGIVAYYQERQGDIVGSMQTVESIQNPREKALALNRLTQNMAGRGDYAGAMLTAHSISDSQPHAMALALRGIASVLYRDGDYATVSSTLQEAGEYAAKIPDSRTAATLLAEMSRIQAMVGDRFGAEMNFQKAQAAFAKVQNADARVQVMLPMVEALVLMGRESEAHKMAYEVEPASYRVHLLGRISWAYARKGDLAKSLTIAEELPASEARERAFESIAYLLIIQKKGVEALQVGEKMKDGFWKARIFWRLVAAGLVDRSYLQRTRVIVDGMEPGREKDRIIPEVARSFARMGDSSSAQEMVASMQETFQQEMAIQVIATAQARSGDWEGALTWAREQESSSARVFALLGTANGLLTWVKVQKRKAQIATPTGRP